MKMKDDTWLWIIVLIILVWFVLNTTGYLPIESIVGSSASGSAGSIGAPCCGVGP